jgi:hypothetical protein
MQTYYPLTQAGFVAVTFVYTALLFNVLRKAIAKTVLPDSRKKMIIPALLIGMIIWLIVVSVLAAFQLLSDFSSMPPRFFIVLIVPLVAIVYLTSTRTARKIIANIPPHSLLYLQSFRIFVEVLLWMLFLDNLLPIQMTFEGRNHDIFSGVFGLVIGFIVQRKPSRILLYVYNIAGLALLINIVTIAILSTPVPFRVFMNEPANTIVTQFPVVWLPALLVPLAYTLHILSFRQIGLLKH